MVVEESSALLSSPRSPGYVAENYIWFSAVCIAFNALSLGYDVGCMNGAIPLIATEFSLTDSQQEAIDGCLSVFAALGALYGAYLADAIGRRGCLVASAASYFLGCVLATIAFSWEVILIARASMGLGVGLSFCSGGLYLSEISPPHLRGTLVSMYDGFINLGIVLGSLVGYFAATSEVEILGSSWRFMMSFSAPFPGIVLCCSPFLPESPRWLIAKGRNDEARETLSRLLISPSIVETAMREFKTTEHTQTAATWGELFKELRNDTHGLRRNLALCIALGFLQQASGAEALLYYCNNFLREAGMGSTSSLALGFVLVGAAKLLGNIAPMVYSDKYGRLPFIYVSSIGMLLVLLALTILTYIGTYGSAEVVLMCLFLFFFSIGTGTLLWVIIPELLPFRWRGRAFGTVVFVNRATSSAVTLSALNIIKAAQVFGFFTLYLILSFASAVLSFTLLPETAGKSLDELTTPKNHAGCATMPV